MKFLFFLIFVVWVILLITNPFVWLYLSTEGPPFISEMGWSQANTIGTGIREWFNVRAFLGFALTEISIVAIFIVGGTIFSGNDSCVAENISSPEAGAEGCYE